MTDDPNKWGTWRTCMPMEDESEQEIERCLTHISKKEGKEIKLDDVRIQYFPHAAVCKYAMYY